MATKNSRINITLEEQAVQLLAQLAKQNHRSVSSIARELILDGLERREDLYFSRLADIRNKENTRLISHKNAWK